MGILKRHTVSNDFISSRLYDYAPLVFTEITSRKGIKKAIKRGEIIVNGHISFDGYWVKPGDILERVELDVSPPKPYHLSFDIIFEDEQLAIVNKPAGIDTSGNHYRTMQNAVMGVLKKSTVPDALNWAKPVHRLDNPTSGLLLFAKTSRALYELGNQFANKTIKKTYHAITMGTPDRRGVISSPIEGKDAETKYSNLLTVPSNKNQHVSLLEVSPATGRTHQIRIHLSSIGHPILGDKLYGKEGCILKRKGLFLCATSIHFYHPISKENQTVSISIPSKFNKLMEREKRMWEKNNQ